MRCEDALPLIDAVAVGELPADAGARLEAHLASCPRCLARARETRRLLELLSELPPVPLTDGFAERVLAAAITARDARLVHRPWIATLRTQIFHGVVRTTGTLVATLAVVALLGGALVFAASNLFTGTPFLVLTHTPTPAPAASASPDTVTVTVSATPVPATPAPTPTSAPATPVPTPTSVPATPPPTEEPTPGATPTPEPTAAPTVAPTVEPTPTPTMEPTPTPLASPTPTPTEKPHRTPPPSASPAPFTTSAVSAAPTPSP